MTTDMGNSADFVITHAVFRIERSLLYVGILGVKIKVPKQYNYRPIKFSPYKR